MEESKRVVVGNLGLAVCLTLSGAVQPAIIRWGSLIANQSINVYSFHQPHLIFHPPQMWTNQEYLGTFPGLQCFQVNETVGWRHMLVAITGGVHCIKTPYHDIPCQYFTISPPRLIFLSRLPPMKRPNCLQYDLIGFQCDPIFSHKKRMYCHDILCG